MADHRSGGKHQMADHEGRKSEEQIEAEGLLAEAEVAYDEEEELGSEAAGDLLYNDEPELPSRKSVVKVMEAINQDGTLRKIIRARRSDFVHNLIHLDGKKFSFEGRDYLRPVYDRDDRQVLLKTSRQVEKCCNINSLVTKLNGSEIKVKDLKIGDVIIGMDKNGFQVPDKIVASQPNGTKPCKRIKTRLGSEQVITFNHPFRKLTSWTNAQDLKVGDKIASLRTQGTFGVGNRPWAALLGLQLGDGHYYQSEGGCKNLGITQKDPIVKEWIMKLSNDNGFMCNDKYIDSRSSTTKHRFSVCGEWAKILDELKLNNKRADEKSIPEEVFCWDEHSTRELIRGLWATDGHCKNVTKSKVDLVYCSTSSVLIRQIRLLLRKFGIITTIREYQPKAKNANIAYIIRVVTRRSIQAFYDKVGPIPSKPFNIPETGSNSNLDTLPKEIHGIIIQSRKDKGSFWKRNSFLAHGLKMNPQYCPTYEKIVHMNDFLKDENIQKILDADIIWDEIESIEDAGECETWAIQTETQTFVSDFIVNHNTTYVGNNLTITSVIMPYNKALYVSPSHTQTRQFSNEKLRPAIEKSPLIKKYFQDSSVSTQVFEKGFTNGSYVFLRSAFRSADRCLVSGTRVLLDGGNTKAIEDLLVGDTLVSLTNHEVDRQKVIGKEPNGEKPTLTLVLESGHRLSGSYNHRFLTAGGLKRLDEITTSDFIPAPLNYLKEAGHKCNLAALLGYLLGDGSLCSKSKGSKNSYHRDFNNNSLDLIEEFERLCILNGFTTKRTSRIINGKNNYTSVIVEKERADELFSKLGILGKGQFNKFIPEKFFSNRAGIKQILRGLYDSNGWVTVNTKNRQSEIGFVTGSLALAKGVHRSLQSIGIYSVLEIRDPKKGGKQKNRWYTIKIRNAFYIRRFNLEVGFISEDKSLALRDCLVFLSGLKETSARDLDVPARDDCAAALKSAGISSHSLWAKYQVSFRCNSHTGPCVATHKVKEIMLITGDSSLKKWLNPDVAWIPAKSVDIGQSLPTWDIEVSGENIFTAEGMFTHNTRGISARILCLDEIQDFQGSEIPVILECTSHFLDARILMAGTPKSLNNPIEEYWKTTTQNEWIVKCQSCGHQNFLDETNIAPTEWYTSSKLPPGPVCKKCGKPIYPSQHGRWISFCAGSPIQGYRIPQLMVPWICGLYDQWLKLLWKRDNYPIGQFYNEVLGISYESASKPITQDELIECCGSYSLWDPDNLAPHVQEAKRFQLTAGVDWGEGVDGSEKSPTGKIRNASYTVLTIGGYVNQKVWKTLLMKRYQGKNTDPDFIVKDICRIMNQLGVTLAGVDWGHGWGVNNHLVRILGPKRVVQFQYLPKLKQKLKWDAIGSRYHLQRNFLMSEYFFDLKHKFVMFPRWSEFQTFAKDILAIYSEYVEYRREIKYDHSSATPDDAYHSLLYAKLASDIYLGKSRRFTFDIEGGIGEKGYSDSFTNS